MHVRPSGVAAVLEPRIHLYRFPLAILMGIVLIAACASGGAAGKAADRSSVKAEDLEEHPDLPIERILQAKIPGVLVRRTADGGIALQLRGASPFSNNPWPLYVINDLPVAAGPDGAMPRIDPRDIDSIKVLTGAEAALYGIEGANGVIVFTLKKATKRD